METAVVNRIAHEAVRQTQRVQWVPLRMLRCAEKASGIAGIPHESTLGSGPFLVMRAAGGCYPPLPHPNRNWQFNSNCGCHGVATAASCCTAPFPNMATQFYKHRSPLWPPSPSGVGLGAAVKSITHSASHGPLTQMAGVWDSAPYPPIDQHNRTHTEHVTQSALPPKTYTTTCQPPINIIPQPQHRLPPPVSATPRSQTITVRTGAAAYTKRALRRV